MKYLMVASFLCLFPVLDGQFAEPKFGKVEMADLSMVKYDKDTTAGALILFDCGNSKIILDNNQRFQVEFERHCQIKIFKNSAFDVADIKIRLYHSSDTKEELKNLEAVTYNLVDGKIVKSKLDNKKIYWSTEDKYVNVSFAFPDVREGSVIELTYNINSQLIYNLRGWNFQYHYPARWSQYTYEIPEYFSYRESSKGYLGFDVNTSRKTFASFGVPSEKVVGPSRAGLERTVTTTEYIKVDAKTTTLATKDAPAFIDEPNIDCDENYIQSLEFELSSVIIPGSFPKNYTETWESVNQRMLEDSDFGELLKVNRFISDTVEAICKGKSTGIEKATAIFDYVQKKVKWDGRYRIWSMNGLKKPFMDRVANSSEINLLLTLMLRTAGLTANPVLFSTRDNGVAISYYPTISKYNSVMSVVNIDGKKYLLDATNKYCPFGVLPANDINGQGRVVDNQTGDWVDLNSNETYTENKNYLLNIDPSGKITGSVTESREGYAGIQFRNDLSSEKTDDDYIKKLQENNKGLSVVKYSFADKYNNYKPVTDALDVEITDNAEIIGDKILINPLLFERIEKNRFTLEERKYPVNFNYPISEQYVFSYTLPEGYTVESMPQPVALSLPDNSVSISYDIRKSGNKIEVQYKRNINKMIFLPSEYKKLKNLYDQMVKKHSEEIILKKVVS